MIPVIETERLILRAPTMDDVAPYTAFGQSERTAYVGGTFTEADAFTRLTAIAGHWQLRGYGRWIIADRKTNQALGTTGPYYPVGWPEPEIAWTVFDGSEGKGIAFEAAQAARRYAYEVAGWTTAISCVDPNNTRSAALAQRMGCTLDGQYEHEVYGVMDLWRHPAPADIADDGKGTSA